MKAVTANAIHDAGELLGFKLEVRTDYRPNSFTVTHGVTGSKSEIEKALVYAGYCAGAEGMSQEKFDEIFSEDLQWDRMGYDWIAY